jgi:hypothetical protein
MANGNPWRALGAIGFVEDAARGGAASYREQAAKLAALAEAEPIGRLRAPLLERASQYDDLGGHLEISRC